jgi:hypothetical protein
VPSIIIGVFVELVMILVYVGFISRLISLLLVFNSVIIVWSSVVDLANITISSENLRLDSLLPLMLTPTLFRFQFNFLNIVSNNSPSISVLTFALLFIYISRINLMYFGCMAIASAVHILKLEKLEYV